MPAGAGNPPNIKMEPPKSNFNIREGGGGGRFNIRGKGLLNPAQRQAQVKASGFIPPRRSVP